MPSGRQFISLILACLLGAPLETSWLLVFSTRDQGASTSTSDSRGTLKKQSDLEMAHADANCRDGELDPLEEDEQGDFGKDLPPWSHLSFQADLVPLPSEVPLDRAGRVARALNRADRDRLRC